MQVIANRAYIIVILYYRMDYGESITMVFITVHAIQDAHLFMDRKSDLSQKMTVKGHLTETANKVYFVFVY